MGLFLYTFLFPGGEEGACRAALRREAEDPELSIRPEECNWHVFPNGPAVLLNDGAVGFDSAGRMSEAVDCPVMGLYIYDDDFWGYDLWRKGKALDQFASLPGYFDEESPPDRPGDAQTVAQCFGVEPERIERYLVPWGEEAVDRDNRAYDDDKATIGDSWQLADFMNALGFDFDLLCPPDEETEKEPNRAAASSDPPPVQPPQYSGKQRKVADTPELPNALTSRDYAFQRVSMLGEEYGALSSLLQYADYQDAIVLLTEAVEAASDEAGFYLLRAFCWKQLETISGRSRKWEMERDLAKALELEPDNVMALRGRCPNTATSARYPRHIQDLTRLMELDPENRDLYQVDRAYRHHWLKDDAAARADLREVLDRGKLWTVDLVYLCGELNLPGFHRGEVRPVPPPSPGCGL